MCGPFLAPMRQLRLQQSIRNKILCATWGSVGCCARWCAQTEPRERSLTGERRHLTVLFYDLVGSTEIAARLDPEEWREIVASYQPTAAEAITHFGGHVAKYLGNGVMAFFGYPQAHDNDAERAVRSGLAILDGIFRLNDDFSHTQTIGAGRD